MPTKKTNLILFGIDSLRADHMSCYGYHHQTTPHIDKFAEDGTLFEQNYSPHIPTTSAYASMLTGLDCFSTSVVALRHKGGLPKKSALFRKSSRKMDITLLASALRAIQVRAALIATSTTPLGGLGQPGAAPRLKI